MPFVGDYWLPRGHGDLTPLRKFAYNPDIDANVQEDVWTAGGTKVYFSAAAAMELVSSDDTDQLSGVGMRTVFIQGVNGDDELTSETVTLDGTAPVATTNTYKDIWRMYGESAGSSETNAGTITARTVTGGTVAAHIDAGEGQTLQSQYTVPDEYKRCHIIGLYANAFKATSAYVELRLQIKKSGTSIWRTRDVQGATTDGSSSAPVKYTVPIVAETGDIIRVVATSGQNNIAISSGFNALLEEKLTT